MNIAIMIIGESVLVVSTKADRGIMNWITRPENTGNS